MIRSNVNINKATMGACSCKRKVKLETKMDLLPSKMTLRSLMSENNRRAENEINARTKTYCDQQRKRRSSCSTLERTVFSDCQDSASKNSPFSHLGNVIINQNIIIESSHPRRIPFGDLPDGGNGTNIRIHNTTYTKTEPKSAPVCSKTFNFYFPTSRRRVDSEGEKAEYTKRETVLVSDEPVIIIRDDKDFKTRIKITSRNSSIDSSFSTPDSRSTLTPIKPNPLTQRQTLLRKNLELERKYRQYKRFKDTPGTYVGDIYNMEYLRDIFQEILKDEKEITLKRGFLKKFNPENSYRLKIVNWLLRIQQVQLQFTEGDFYLAVNFMDHILAAIEIPRNMYQLVALTSIWIATKLSGTFEIDASELLKLTNGAFTTTQLNRMERKIMKIFGFHFHTLEPTTCIFYYLKLFNLEDNELMQLTALYILDCLALTPDFSSTPISILCAAVINYTLNLYQGRSKSVENVFYELIMVEDISYIERIEKKIDTQLKIMNSDLYIAREPFKKYSSENMLCVSTILEKKMQPSNL